MQILTYKGWRVLSVTDYSVNEIMNLFDAIMDENFSIQKGLKEHHRSVVLKIRIDGKSFVLKKPLEKNQRKWIRFLTWFRLGEAFKNVKGMMTLINAGIKTTQPIMAAEKRSFGMVVDSWLVYEYLDGTTCLDKPETHPNVVTKLQEMHARKLLHGDPQIRNFISVENEIYVIDCNPKTTGFLGFDRAYEWAYLRKSADGIEDHFGKIKNWWLYKLAFWYDKFDRKMARIRKNIKRGLGLTS